MNDISGVIFILLLIVYSLSIGLGINLRKWYGWVQVLSGFLFGLLIGPNIAGKLVFGIFFALMALLLGPIAWRRLHS